MDNGINKSERLNKILDYVGAFFGVIGALLIASNIGLNFLGYAVFLVSATCYTWLGWRTKRPGILIMNLIFIGINILGLYRWR